MSLSVSDRISGKYPRIRILLVSCNRILYVRIRARILDFEIRMRYERDTTFLEYDKDTDLRIRAGRCSYLLSLEIHAEYENGYSYPKIREEYISNTLRIRKNTVRATTSSV